MTFELFRSEEVMVIGDSLASGQMGHEKIGFPARLGVKLRKGRPGLQVNALDILGEMTGQLRTRMAEIPRRYRKRNVAVLWCGIKDTGLSKDGRFPLVVGTVFQENVRFILRQFPGNIPVFVLGYYRIDGTKTNPWPVTGFRYDPGRTLDFNDILRSVAESRSKTVFVPTVHLIKPRDLVADGVHLNPYGYSKVVRVLAPQILKVLDAME